MNESLRVVLVSDGDNYDDNDYEGDNESDHARRNRGAKGAHAPTFHKCCAQIASFQFTQCPYLSVRVPLNACAHYFLNASSVPNSDGNDDNDDGADDDDDYQGDYKGGDDDGDNDYHFDGDGDHDNVDSDNDHDDYDDNDNDDKGLIVYYAAGRGGGFHVGTTLKCLFQRGLYFFILVLVGLKNSLPYHSQNTAFITRENKSWAN